MKKTLLLAVVVLGMVVLLQLLLGRSAQHKNYEFLPDMYRSSAPRSQSASPHLPNGSAQQAPVPGTIARGQLPLQFGPSVEDASQAGEELENPYGQVDPNLVARGREVYQTYCQVCHGADGKGSSPVTRRGFPPPPSLLEEQARTMKDGEMFHIVTFGKKNMPAYGGLIDTRDRWLSISHLRTLQKLEP